MSDIWPLADLPAGAAHPATGSAAGGIDLAGGKAVNLGVLIRAGFDVPAGFCVATTAYDRVVAGLLDPITAGIGECSATDLARLNELAARARALVEAADVPADLAAGISAAYAELGTPASPAPVAVRSSATAEDLAFASFAGQQDTYLNVVGADAVLAAVRRCWASLWTDRAVVYRATNGVDPAGVSLAVVVQVMVESAAAGVMFTSNPVTGTRHEVVLDANPGLGEAVVSGAVNPDHFVVDTVTRTVVQRRIGRKEITIHGRAGGGTERVVRPDGGDDQDTACLSDRQVVELAALGRRVDDSYGSPQDIEWALDAQGRFWLTQSRPITTLYPLLSRPDQPGLRAFMCLSLAQGLTRPITPMGLAVFGQFAAAARRAAGLPGTNPLVGAPAFRQAGLRGFVDVTAALRNPLGRRIMLAAFSVMEARAAVVLGELGSRPEFATRRGSVLILVRALLRVVVRTRVPVRVALGVVSPRHAYRALARSERALRATTSPAEATPEQRLDEVLRRVGTESFLLMPRSVSYAIGGFALFGLARRLLRGVTRPGELATVLRGLPHNVTTEMDVELWHVTERVRADAAAREAVTGRAVAELTADFQAGRLPTAVQDGMRRFLDQYGHRAVAEIDLGMPRWSDDPSHLFGVLKNYLQLDDPGLAPAAQFAAGARAGEAMVEELAGRLSNPLRARIVRFALGRARALAGLRETPKFLLILALTGIRAELQRIGEALAAAGRIDDPDDVFFLDLVETRRALSGVDLHTVDLHTVVRDRRATYEQELRRRHIPRILLSDGTEPETLIRPAAAPEGSLIGSAASAGSVTGRARVVLDPVGARLEPGEILVAPSTDPGWTPLFLTAGGLVMEMGGSNSHGAVVAREYGIPAVVGVPDATVRLHTGQLITVDGASGLVTPS